MAEDDEHAPGWAAIDAACAAVHGKQEPLHVAPKLPMVAGGDDPLDGISAYRGEDPPHWHLVTYGMTELYDKESDDPLVSGWGFEYTLRLERPPGQESPPAWVFSLLQNLARYVFRSGNWFAPGHQMDVNGPIALDHDTALSALLFVEDPDLGVIHTPNGRIQFLQVLGITGDEREAAVRWNTDGLADLLAKRVPGGVISLGRSSILDDPEARAAVEAGIAADGSSCGFVFGGLKKVRFDDEGIEVLLGANQVDDVAALLPGRIPFGRELRVAGERSEMLRILPGRVVGGGPEDEPKRWLLELPADVAREVAAALRPVRGTYTVDSAPGLRFTVVPSEIKDKDGKVVRIVG